MHHATGRAGDHQASVVVNSLERQTQGMDGETLLDKGAALKPLCHSHLLKDEGRRCLLALQNVIDRMFATRLSKAWRLPAVVFNILSQLGNANIINTPSIGNHTGIQHRIECPIRGIRLNGAIFPRTRRQEPEQGEGQDEDPARARPGVMSAHDEICRKESAGNERAVARAHTTACAKRTRARPAWSNAAADLIAGSLTRQGAGWLDRGLFGLLCSSFAGFANTRALFEKLIFRSRTAIVDSEFVADRAP